MQFTIWCTIWQQCYFVTSSSSAAAPFPGAFTYQWNTEAGASFWTVKSRRSSTKWSWYSRSASQCKILLFLVIVVSISSTWLFFRLLLLFRDCLDWLSLLLLGKSRIRSSNHKGTVGISLKPKFFPRHIGVEVPLDLLWPKRAFEALKFIKYMQFRS